MFLSDWNNIDLLASKIDVVLNRGSKVIDPFTFLGVTDNPNSARKVSEIFAKNEFSNNLKNQILVKDRTKKPRIAYFSGDFHDHPVLHLIMDVFKNHDKSKFDIFGFSFGPKKNDEWYKEVKKYFFKFEEINEISDNDVVNLIRHLEIDIAIDLTCYTGNHRSSIFSNRMAPIQINFLGYPGTSGIQNMDFIIADEMIIPKEIVNTFQKKFCICQTVISRI